MSRRLKSYCGACVRAWQPSWLEYREDPLPCPGGCGAPVSEWTRSGGRRYAACSSRCARLVRLERSGVGLGY